jgi:myo-inositol-1(or 4)-monophosphatase
MKNEEWFPVLRKAAKAGKAAILKNYDPTNRNEIVKRGVGGDMTLRIDELSESAIFRSLKKDLGAGTFVFLSEEAGEINEGDTGAKPVVVCDPLDGSHNAQVGIPFFSIALSVIGPKDTQRTFGNIVASVILAVRTGDEYTAIKGKGSFHNGIRLGKRDVKSSKIQTLLVETGDVDYLRERILTTITSNEVYKMRLLGSAALSLCLLAEGSADAMIFAQPGGARTIDSPAGYLIATEAGCTFRDLSKNRKVKDIEVGFGSRVNLLGFSSPKFGQLLEKKLGPVIS